MRSLPLGLLALLLASAPLVAAATTVDDLCSPPGVAQGTKPCACTDTPARCRFTRTPAAVLTPNSVLDFGSRRLELAPRVKIDAGTRGVLTVRAADVDLEATKDGTSGLVAAGGRIRVEATGSVGIRRSGANAARIDVAGADSSDITIEADGDVLMEGLLDASTTVVDQFAGDVTIRAHAVTVTGLIDVHGGTAGSAGTVTIDTVRVPPEIGGDIRLTAAAKIDAMSGDSFAVGVELLADGDVFSDALLDLQAVIDGGSGGFLTIDAAGSVTLGGTVRGGGQSSTEDRGDAGDVQVDAAGSIALAGYVDLGGPPGGSGGNASFTAALDISQTGTLDCLGRGTNGLGGEAVYSADRGLTLGTITCTGGDIGTGGVVDASAWCSLTVPAGKTIDTRGPDGNTTLAGGGTMTIAGTLRATAGNEFQYRDTPPIIAPTAVIVPAVPGARQLAGLIPCGGNPPAGCGNGLLDAGEACDPSAPNGTQACPGSCAASCDCLVCGDGDIDPGEACDDGNTAPCDGCAADCSRSDDMCGDGVTECGEGADDGNNAPCDGVSGDCRVEACGNGTRECDEECDNDSASCSATCTVIVVPGNCGNGLLDDNEGCDDGNTTPCDGCSATCQTDGCGNSNTEPACGEQCDDFNTVPGDGCSAACQIEVCGNGVRDEGEECDTGAQNGQLGTPCSTACRLAWCGNGKVDPREACDDGNANECDGCRANCIIPSTPCPVCTTGGPESCVPCAAAVDCDPLQACGASTCVTGVCTPVDPPSCDDGNACTTDRCDPARGCVSAPIVCQDTAACDGTQTCDPASGQCRSGPAPDCGDQDECTVDSCSEATPGFRCTNELRSGLDGATCRLGALRGLIDTLEMPTATRKQLRKQAGSIARRLPAAAGTGRKATKARKQVSKGLRSLGRMLSKAQRKIDDQVFVRLNTELGRTTEAIGTL